MHTTFFVYNDDLPKVYIRATQGVKALYVSSPGTHGNEELCFLRVTGDMDVFYRSLIEAIFAARPLIKAAVFADALVQHAHRAAGRGQCPGCDKVYENMDLNRCPICDIGLLEVTSAND